ncbi:MAG: hypothetical protein KJO69_02810 [Gammaproteobacteria bacterium]|nr:hypothetical protein [Gammaproteobacteria bacterium]
MPDSTIDNILESLHSLQAELETEIDKLLQEKRKQFRYTLIRGKVRFDREVRKLQRRYKIGSLKYLASARVGHILIAPVIYSLFFPLILLDIMVTLYQHIGFRVYGIQRVKRSDYIVIDRQHLAYLNLIEKINCSYCGYANGLIEYTREVGARTEQYWCPIKHSRRTPEPHQLAGNFVDYGDADEYKNRLDELRQQLHQHDNS